MTCSYCKKRGTIFTQSLWEWLFFCYIPIRSHFFWSQIHEIDEKNPIFLFIIQTISIHCTRENEYISMKTFKIIEFLCNISGSLFFYYIWLQQSPLKWNHFSFTPLNKSRNLFVAGSSNFVGLNMLKEKIFQFSSDL